MKMKKLLLVFLVFLGLIGGISIISCQQDDSAGLNSLSDYDKVGKLHNEGLEYVFDYLKKKGVITRTQSDANRLRELSDKAICKFFKEKKLEITQTRSLQDNIELIEKLNSKQKVYYDKLISVVLDHSLNYETTQKQVAEISKEIQENLTQVDASPLLYGTAIAKYTLEYWYKNWEKWRIEIGGVDALTFGPVTRTETPESSNDDFSWKEVGKADISGGVGGAVGGAVAGSVTDAIGQLLDWL